MSKKYKIGIIGLGMVGGALQRYFARKKNYKLYLYDKFKKIGGIDDVNQADYIYICVPTPNNSNGQNISAINQSIKQLKGNKIIIIKSTILPRTTDSLQGAYPQHKILFNPEFLTEETADNDMAFPDRQIIGFTQQSYNVAIDVMQQLPLAPFQRIVPAVIAEFVKYYGNAWFATKVAFNNQMYDLAQKLQIPIYDEIVECAAADKRIGRTHLKIYHKGFRGYGGKCLPKDSRAIIKRADELDVDLSILKEVEKYNNRLQKQQENEKDR